MKKKYNFRVVYPCLRCTSSYSSITKLSLSFERESFAPTLARRVFPQPGGPASSTPGGVVSPNAANWARCFTGAYDRLHQT